MRTARADTQASLLPYIGIRSCELGHANHLLTKWEHPLGPCNRPFRSEAWLLEIGEQPAALAVSASTVSKTVAGFRRDEVVELARVARAPEHRYLLRPMIRLWRVYLAHEWASWPVRTAVSYAVPGTPGDLYRFDGWERVARCKPSRGGGTWTATDPAVTKVADGIKTLWIYRYESEAPSG